MRVASGLSGPWISMWKAGRLVEADVCALPATGWIGGLRRREAHNGQACHIIDGHAADETVRVDRMWHTLAIYVSDAGFCFVLIHVIAHPAVRQKRLTPRSAILKTATARWRIPS